ncbi:FecR family protein [Chelatococcus sp. GCM10030263]|uniref:FecR family protein n=1 Tax=Chelatococcus sp. GCM10030263 TaxID=3273387 RepID=UPI00361CDC28
MRTDDEPTDSQRDEAALWLAKKTGGSLGPEEARAHEAWLNADRRHRRAYDELRVLYAQLEMPASRVAVDRTSKRAMLARFLPHGAWLLAPIVPALALLIVWAIEPPFVQNWRADVVTSERYLTDTVLPDGSTAKLGGDTALALSFEDGQRRVELLRGEAFFEVRHDAPGVFSVEAHGDVIRDIGTKFNVDVTAGRTEVVVAEGAVDVTGRSDAGPVRLDQGNQIVVQDGRAGRVEPADTDLALAWMSGRLVVQGASVADLITALQRHHSGRILVRGALADRKVSGTFPLTDIDGSLETLAAAVGGKLVHVTPLVTILF